MLRSMTKRPEPGFQTLLPDDILGAIESTGRRCSGELLALNSYENRVYRVGMRDDDPLVAKFYRPARWSDAAIEEEHHFAIELEALDLPVVAPLVSDGQSLNRYDEFRFALYPCKGGRWPTLDDDETLRQLGRLTARIHLLGERGRFSLRPGITLERFGYDSRDYLLDNEIIPDELYDAYASLADDVLERVEWRLDELGPIREIRIHGDLHPGNVLQDGEQLHIVDTDDVCNGPAIQDLWMFMSGDADEQSAQLGPLLEGYESFRDFDYAELAMIEPLRTLRLMHYSAWLARRWQDPAFKQAFPWFDSQRYWNDHILSLREQMALLDAPPIRA